ncbi:MAG: HAMP domain-containing sensor histidine kinase [Leptolyngbyaceae cyanobacterium bins.302]|nr:HAMP domain-containing sensor histidine kinase [Leptolyngbyaceae cyanobacterium bins.302]
MFQTTRRRLALWYTTVTAIVLLLFASGVYFYVRSTLIERVDDTLNHVVEVVERSLVIEPENPHTEGDALKVNVEASFRDNAVTREDDRIDIEWFSPTGELLWSTFFEPLNIPLHVSNGETVRVGDGGMGGWGDGEQESESSARKDVSRNTSTDPSHPPVLILRQVTQRVELGRWMLGYLRVSHPWFEVSKPSREFVLDLILGTGLMIGAVGAIGWFLSGLAMAPVRESYQRLKQFTADASHELRSPIAVIQTNVQVALADPDPDPQSQRDHLQVVERLTRRLGRLVDDLLFLARQDSGMVQAQPGDVDLEELLWEVIEEQQTLADEKKIQISLLPSPTDPEEAMTLQGDRDQLARLFTNLVGNAVQYTPAQGNVVVELQRVGRNNNPSLQVTVQDTGIGIPAEALPQIFDRFYRVDPARSQASSKGSGLGLAIAQVIVQNHQGQIQVESTEHQGTTVKVLLPQKALNES